MLELKGCEKFAIAQLGSSSIDQQKFSRIVTEETSRQILPQVLRAAQIGIVDTYLSGALAEIALLCENKMFGAARDTFNSMHSRYDFYKSAYDFYKPAYSAFIASDKLFQFNESDVSSSICAALVAYYGSVYAPPNVILNLSAQIGLDALIELKSPGCEWLHLVKE